jgi:hypothetical protein
LKQVVFAGPLALIFASYLCFFPKCLAVTESTLPSAPITFSSSAKSGPFALIEWNPADLLFSRLRFSGEYIIVDGFAFGAMLEYQKQDFEKYQHGTSSMGVTATQYFDSQTLKGPFVKGEMAAMGSVFRIKDAEESQEKAIYGLHLGIEGGYRFSFSDRLTGSASYGARRVVPDFVATQGDGAVKDWVSQNKLWSMRVQVGLGITL